MCVSDTPRAARSALILYGDIPLSETLWMRLIAACCATSSTSRLPSRHQPNAGMPPEYWPSRPLLGLGLPDALADPAALEFGEGGHDANSSHIGRRGAAQECPALGNAHRP
jgi:hypothetical protein